MLVEITWSLLVALFKDVISGGRRIDGLVLKLSDQTEDIKWLWSSSLKKQLSTHLRVF